MAVTLFAMIGIVVSVLRLAIGSLVHAVKRKMAQWKGNNQGSDCLNQPVPQIKISPQIYTIKDVNGSAVSHQYHDVETILG